MRAVPPGALSDAPYLLQHPSLQADHLSNRLLVQINLSSPRARQGAHRSLRGVYTRRHAQTLRFPPDSLVFMGGVGYRNQTCVERLRAMLASLGAGGSSASGGGGSGGGGSLGGSSLSGGGGGTESLQQAELPPTLQLWTSAFTHTTFQRLLNRSSGMHSSGSKTSRQLLRHLHHAKAA